MTTKPTPRLVIFDCDGVLIDSEGPSCRLIARDVRGRGGDLDDERALDFAGMSLTEIRERLNGSGTIALPDDWVAKIQEQLVELMGQEARAIDGAEAMVAAVIAMGLPVRVGSNSSMAEMAAKFERVRFAGALDGRTHSARDMGAPKPAPNVFLHAARQEQVPPDACVVLEDSDTGLAAAHAAGMTCVLLRAAAEPVPVWAKTWPDLHRITHPDAFAPLLHRLCAQRRQAA
ncbi:phosphatase [Ameyamaea chiangmaiensis NBRC 103196]|uniref:HAD family phosphatase n=1 Tax=Ameyamaea chiangmaiensis TaxID=442969 RepID=A0A850P9T7_9PROT|nr:HAD family phosphatase [Ameyamaea chiangmaiensis]MBS4074957.1 HAD family phosphatase [Ameyamaea chiangmaiensis]NVN39723.1 HAD family phosphatase [Ameyamaea chiangmaiensis]GBQ63336.1 phosphatase [Ameyamaea chiangmaiensis NBRC 103196]